MTGFGALVNSEGEVTDFLRLQNLTKRARSFRQQEREEKVCIVKILKYWDSHAWARMLPMEHSEQVLCRLYCHSHKRDIDVTAQVSELRHNVCT